MAKALRTAAIVVGAAALAATGLGAVGVGIGALGVSAGTLATVGTIGTAVAGGLSLAAQAVTPKGTLGGAPNRFKIDKEAGIPVVLGRTYVGGNVVHRQYYSRPGSKMKNQAESWVTVLSLGPVKSVGPLLIDKTSPVSFDSSGTAIGTYNADMWLRTQLGACPEPAALAGPFGAFPGWSSSSKLSGLAADLWTLDFDTKGDVYPNGVPERGRVVEGMFVYDPRQDSTYPGGSGPCRLGQEATYVYSENPAPHAITWAFGRYQNGVLMAGGGLAASGFDMAPFVEWANVCDANGWKVGGQVYTESDNAYDVLRMICQAGSAEPVPTAAQLSVTFSAPRVAIATITSADIAGDVDVPAMVTRRKRRNTIIPKVRLESHGWEVVPLDAVSVPDYLIVDGGKRPKELIFPLVQQATQGAQLALYQMLDERELDGIVIPAKVYALGYRPGDCLTLQIPEANLIARNVVVRQREIDVGSLGVALTCRTDDPAKHAFALGQSGTPPSTPDLSNPGIDRTAPSDEDWDALGGTIEADGVAVPAIVITSTADKLAAGEVLFDYRAYIAAADPDAGWLGASIEPPTTTRKAITSVAASTQYEVGIRYRTRGATSARLILGPVLTGAYEGVRGADGVSAITLISDGNVEVRGNQVRKASGGSAWNASAYSVEGFQNGAYVSVVAPPQGVDLMIGLSADPAASSHYAAIDAAWYFRANGTIDVYQSGASATADQGYGVYFPGQVYTIQVANGAVRYVGAGNVLIDARPINSDRTFYVDSSIFTPGAEITGVTAGSLAKNGEAGPPGYNNATVTIYRRSATQPALPTATATWTFASASIAGLNNGWSTSIPSGADPVWAAAATASSQAATDAIAASEWTSPVQAFANGATGGSGINTKSLFIYQRAASAPPLPSQNAVYTFSSATLAGLNNGWSPSIPDGIGIVWVSTATALSPTDNDNINPGEWAAVAKLAQDGAAGADGFAVDTETTNFVQPVYSGGASKPTWTGGSGTIRLNKGGQRITTGVTYAVLGVTDIASLSLSGDTFSFAGATDDAGEFTIRATYNGVNYDKVVSVKKVYDGEAAFKGSVAITGTNVAATTATGVTTAPGGRGLTVSAAVSYIVSTGGAGSYQAALSLYWRNVTDNGPWNLLGTQNGSGATRVNQSSNPQEPEYVDTPGTVSAAYSFTGPSSDKQIGFEARVAAAAGVGPVNFYNGSVKLEVSS